MEHNQYNDTDEIDSALLAVFGTPQGMKVLNFITKMAKSARVERINPNPNTALYRVAQMDLVEAINNKIERAKRNER